MKKLDKPKINFSVVFDTCIKSIREANLRNDFLSNKGFFIDADNKYNELGNHLDIKSFKNYEHLVVSSSSLIDHSSIIGLFSRLRDNKNPREYYDAIKNSNDRCLYCNMGPVGSLDHYLPKEDFPLLSIAPSNLIPCCHDCNFKLNDLFRRYKKDLPLAIHPYFEHQYEIYNKQWIFADVPKNQDLFLNQNYFNNSNPKPFAIKFYTDFSSLKLNSDLTDRLSFQFNNLILNPYNARCSEVTSSEIARILKHRGKHSLLAVNHRAYLKDVMTNYPINSIYYITYHALSESTDYLDHIENKLFHNVNFP